MEDPLSMEGAKRELRREMRAMRRSLPDREVRSDQLWSHLESCVQVGDGDVVMVFDSIVGEPDTVPLVARLRSRGATVSFPEDVPPPDPATVDVVIVPGIAFTADGRRLGQGGGWYDRFLASVDDGCVTIGVCFAEQLVGDLPTEPHDVAVGVVVTDTGVSA